MKRHFTTTDQKYAKSACVLQFTSPMKLLINSLISVPAGLVLAVLGSLVVGSWASVHGLWLLMWPVGALICLMGLMLVDLVRESRR